MTPTTIDEVVSAAGSSDSSTVSGNIFGPPNISGITVQNGGTYRFERTLSFGAQGTSPGGELAPNVLSGGIEVIGGPFTIFSGNTAQANSGSFLVTSAPVIITSNVVSSGVTEEVAATGSAVATTILNGGTEAVLSGGYTRKIII